MTKTNPLFLALLEAHKKREAAALSSSIWQRITAEEFVEASEFCDVPISPAQRALVRAADGISVDHLDPQDMAYHLGTDGSFAPSRRPRIVAVRSGRRSGKSLIGSAVSLVLGAMRARMRREPRPGERPERDGLVGVRKGELVRGVIVTPRLQQGLGTFQLLSAMVQASPRLGKHLVGDPAAESFKLRRDDGQEVQIRVLAAAPRGVNLRGGWFVGAVFDEADFFGEEDASVRLDDQIKALQPALLSDGQMWLTSSPWDESGDFARRHSDAWGNPGEAVSFHSSSMRMNPTLDAEAIEEDRKKDPDFVSREYDAVPMVSGGDQFFPEAAIVAACTRDVLKLEPNGAPHWAGSDPGLRKNSAVIALARHNAGKAELAFYEELIPPRKSKEQAQADIKLGIPPGLAPSQVFTSFARTALGYKAECIKGDQWYEDSAIEHMGSVKSATGDSVYYSTVHDNQTSTALFFTQFRGMLNEGKAILPRDQRLMQQMRDTKVRRGPNGPIIVLPKTGAAHGDLLKSVVLAMVQVPLEIDMSPADDDNDWDTGDSRWGGAGRGF